MKKVKGLGYLLMCCTLAAMLTGCGTNYIVKPSGTNENAVNGTFNVPERYKKNKNSADSDKDVTQQQTVNSVLGVADADDTMEAAILRKTAFEDILKSDKLSVTLVRMRSYGESSEVARMQCVYEDDKAYYAMYNANEELVQEVISEGDMAWLIDRDAEKKLETERGTYKYCDVQTLIDLFTLTDINYAVTYEDSIEGKTLLCDEYTSDSRTVRYYYDTAENLILLRESTDSDEVTTLFSELTTFISEDFWNENSVDYVTEMLIK